MYRKINSSWMKHWDFEILDIICLEIAFFLAYVVRHIDTFPKIPDMYLRLGLLLAVFDIVVIFFSKNYKGILQRNKWRELIAVIQHVTTVELLLLFYEYITKEAWEFSRTVFLLSWGFAIVFCLGERFLWKRVIRKRIMHEKNQARLLVISSAERVSECIRKMMQKDYREFKITCVSLLEGNPKKIDHVDDDVPVLQGKENLMEYVRQNVVDEVYIDFFESKSELNELVNIFLSMGITVRIGMGFLPDDLPNQLMEKVGESHVITTSIKVASGWQLAIKRLMDIAGALVGLLFTGIAYIFVAPAIKKASPGPVFFKQKRVGKNGRIFHIYKFRSMYMDAEERKKELMAQNEMQGLMFKMENDPRIIGSEKGPGKGIGNFIRKTSIDELPQFWNILKGDMSLIGTRPPTVNEYEQYDLHHKIRLSMKPGLTGMWQTSGRSEITDFEEVVKLDTEYIANWSLGLDFLLILKTFKVVLNKEGSK